MKPSTAAWRTASRSTENGGNCVQLASVGDLISIRDSKDPGGPVVAMKRDDFQRFAEVLKSI
ncbi:DUF397 domain-containing protein [Actinomadura chokoriensis]|uniref:DUF397 domain-containing protein n=1 Tax=Actinomadura chokoriensis TaxID=454156 RepID=UPI0031FA360E